MQNNQFACLANEDEVDRVIADSTTAKKKRGRPKRVDPFPITPFMGRKWIETTNTTVDQESNSASISLLSYNILCQMYARTSNFPSVPYQCLEWKYRKERIMKEIVSYKADILCIQEMDRYEKYWRETFEKCGYASIYKQRTGLKPDGCAVFWNHANYEYVDSKFLEFNVLSAVTEELFDPDRLTNNVGMMVALKHRQSGKVFIVANIHVYWNPQFPEIKLEQTLFLIESLRTFQQSITTTTASSTEIPTLICGDFNSLPDSEVYELLAKGKTSISRYSPTKKESLQPTSNCVYFSNRSRLENLHRNILTQEVTPITTEDINEGTKELVIFKQSLKLESVYTSGNRSEPAFTNYTANFVGCLDYIWKSPTVAVQALLEPIDATEASKLGSLPSMIYPSDHISLLVKIRI